MQEITFKQFSQLMTKRKRTVDDLVELFRGKIEEPRDFFERAMSCHWRNPETRRMEDRSSVVIPYRSVIEFYLKEKSFVEDQEKDQRALAEKRKPNLTPEQRAQMRERMQRLNRAKSVKPEN